MQTSPRTLSDLLSAGHPETALVGVSIAALRAWVAKEPALAALAISPVVGTLSSAAGA